MDIRPERASGEADRPQGTWRLLGFLLAGMAVGGYGIVHAASRFQAVLCWLLLLLSATMLSLVGSVKVAVALRAERRPGPVRPRTQSIASNQSVLRVARESRSQQDVFRRYKILLDGRRVGRISNGETFEIPITPGPHTLQLRIDWTGSPELHFVATGHQAVEFTCVSTGRLVDSPAKLAASRKKPDAWIELRRLSH